VVVPEHGGAKVRGVRVRSAARKKPKASVRMRNLSSKVPVVDPRGRRRWSSSSSTQRRALTCASDSGLCLGLDVHERGASRWSSTYTTTIDLLHVQIQEAGRLLGGERLLLVQEQAKEGAERGAGAEQAARHVHSPIHGTGYSSFDRRWGGG
jgi:hypothetical protein